MDILENIDKYLNEASYTKDKYYCAGGGNNKNCYWTGDEPIKMKGGKFKCPVCGGYVYKTPKKMKKRMSEAKKFSKQEKEDIRFEMSSDKAFDRAQIFIWKTKKKVKDDKELEMKIMKKLEKANADSVGGFVRATKREGYPEISKKIIKEYG